MWCRKFQPSDLFLQLVQHDPTPNNMAKRGNNDGRQNKDFNIDSQVFTSDDDDFDDYDFSNDALTAKLTNLFI